MKKGFTLVELAIVLVVIGLLMGMAFKGKSLVDAARIKADVNKIDKLSTGLNVYYSKYDTLPGINGDVKGPDDTPYPAQSSAAVYQTMINEGLVKASDFKTSSGATYWAFIGCEHDVNGWKIDNISESSNICIYRSSDVPTATDQQVNPAKISNPSISGVSICQIETLLDDKNLISGDGRTSSTGPKISEVDTTGWNCANTDTTNGGNGLNNQPYEYLYRVF